jgi:CHAD domain-containing protein
VREPAELWRTRRRSLEKARQSARQGDPEALHDLRVALRRTSTTASALARDGVSRRATRLVRSLSDQRQLEVDRDLLARIARLGFLSPDAAAALAARWDELATRDARRIAHATDGPEFRRLLRRLSRLEHKERSDAVARLERERRRAEAALTTSLDGKDDRTVHRYRIAVKRARYLAEDLAALGLRQWSSQAEREKRIQDALGRWNDLRLFARRVSRAREEAESRGAVTLAAELRHLSTALEPTVAAVRRAAVEASRRAEASAPARGRRASRA